MSIAEPPLATPKSPESRVGPSKASVVVAAVVCLAFAPILGWYGYSGLYLKPHYQFFPIVLLGAALLAYPAAVRLSQMRVEPSIWGPAAGVLSWALLVVAAVVGSPWVGAVAFWLFLASVPLTMGGWRGVWLFTPALAFLLLIIPPPFGVDNWLVGKLQDWTSRLASSYLDYTGVYHALAGNIVEIAGKRYLVEEACSGIHSLLSIIAATLFYIFLVRMRPVRATLLMLSAVFWVLVMNVTRVYSIVFFDQQFKFDLGTGWKHEAFGFVLFGLSLLLLASTNKFLQFLLGGDDQATVFDNVTKPTEWLRNGLPLKPRGWLASPRTAGLFAVAILAQASDLPKLIATSVYTGTPLSEKYKAIGLDTLPAQHGPWQRQTANSETGLKERDSGDPFGQYSRVWQYRMPAHAAALSLDFPFPGWHDLRTCYRNTGWTIKHVEMMQHELPGPTPRKYHWVQVFMERPVEQQPAFLCFTTFDESGTPQIPDTRFDSTAMTDRINTRAYEIKSGWLQLLGRGPGFGNAGTNCLQVQLVTESYIPMTESEFEASRQLFFTAAANLHAKIVAAQTAK